MTQQEIQERNKDIALMLDWKEYKPENNWFWGKKEMTYYKGFDKVTWTTPRVYMKFFEFHSDWRWLMDAVEFIEKLEYDFHGKIIVFTHGNNCTIQGSKLVTTTENFHPAIFLDYYGTDKKEAVFLAVAQFAKLYNNKQL